MITFWFYEIKGGYILSFDGKIDIDNLEFKKIADDIKIKWNDFLIVEHDYTGDISCYFEIEPLEYLNYAKENFSTGTNKGLIDGLSNAKRAIECQIDTIISHLGYDFKLFDSSKEYRHTKTFIKEYYKGQNVQGITDRLKFLNILGLAPLFLVSKIRYLRNIMEHEYILPPEEAVREAIDVAELFIHSSDRLITFMITTLCFGSNFKKQSTYGSHDLQPKYIVIEYPFGKKKFQVTFVENNNGCMPYEIHWDYPWIKITAEDKFYPYLLYATVNKDYTMLPKMFGCKIPTQNIKYIIEHP